LHDGEKRASVTVRAATPADVKEGRAVFGASGAEVERSSSTAMLGDPTEDGTGKKAPVIVIQTEEVKGMSEKRAH
jgi:hypothetical protein